MQQGAKQGVRGALAVFNAVERAGEDGARESCARRVFQLLASEGLVDCGLMMFPLRSIRFPLAS
jgi:hypothetical protein